MISIEGLFLIRYDQDTRHKLPFDKLTKNQQKERFFRPGGVYGFVHSPEVTFRFNSKLYFKELSYRAIDGYRGFIKFYCSGELV